jgi:ATP-binding cassette subfamily G (WHITE) protein 8 (sterolin 2)
LHTSHHGLCRSNIFELFDLVLLLSGGRVVYFGQAKEMVDYFTKLGFPCPELTNPCDYYGKYRQRY